MNDPERLQPGVYLVDAACPRCGAIEEVLVRLGVVLTQPDDDLGSIRVKVKGKAREHDCRQDRLAVTITTAGREGVEA